MSNAITPEIDVIIGTALYLYENGWNIECVSIPTGQRLDLSLQKEKLLARFSERGIPTTGIVFPSNGPDIVARQGDKIWKIECKGLGTGKPPTVRNNFDRAVASAVSYFDGEATHIGLAIPMEYAFRGFVRGRVPKALRIALNLWVFLLEPDGCTIKDIRPDGHSSLHLQRGVQHDVI